MRIFASETTIETSTEYGGYVKNNTTGDYDMLFIGECSACLAYGRAKEKAENRNNYSYSDYDTSDIIVKRRDMVITTIYSEWENDSFNGKFGEK